MLYFDRMKRVRPLFLLLLLTAVACEPFDLERKNFADCKAPSGNVDAVVSKLQVNVTLTNPNQELRTIDWDFGDGRSLPQSGTKAAYLYDRPGTYTIRAKLTTICSQTANASRTVTVAN
jgi:PKD repeat protein